MDTIATLASINLISVGIIATLFGIAGNHSGSDLCSVCRLFAVILQSVEANIILRLAGDQVLRTSSLFVMIL